MKPVRIGTRESILAVIQSEMVGKYLTDHGIEYELVPMKTTGDKILNKTLDKIGGKGLFVKELDQALLDGRSDISVHSLKDLPMEVPEQLPVLAYSGREDPRDALVLPEGQLWFAKQNGIDVRLGDPKEEVPGKSVVLPASPALFQYKEADIDHFRQSLIKKAVKKAGVKPSESDLQFLAEETKTDVAFVTKTLEENGLL